MELTTDRSRSHRLALVLAFVLAAIGLALAAGGIWLITLGGSAYYAIAGIALCVTAWLLFRGSAAAVWLYGAVFLATVVWAFWETGADAWALVPRIVGPAVLLVLVLLVAPLLRKAPFGWKGALASAVGVVIVVALGFVVTARSGPDAVKRDLPGRTFA